MQLAYTSTVDRSAPGVQESGILLNVEADLIRVDILEALQAAGGGHYGGCLSVVDVLLTLYRCQLRVSPLAPKDPSRDRLILSKGHAAVALYAVLRRLGFFDHRLADYASFGSPLEGHPDMATVPGVDFSTGSLGQGLSVGAGMALALRNRSPQVWVILGDGECQEGQVWEAAMVASQCRLGNLHAIVDYNRFQEWGWNRQIAFNGSERIPVPVSKLSDKWSSFGWTVYETDGHDHAAVASSLQLAADTRGGPSVVIAHTVKGKGYPYIERDPLRFHCTTLTDSEYRVVRGTK